MEAMVGLEGVLTSHHAVRKNVNFSEDFSFYYCLKNLLQAISRFLAVVSLLHLSHSFIWQSEAVSLASFCGLTVLQAADLFEDDVREFHTFYKEVCDKYESGFYDKCKMACDAYFYIPARKEHRGTGGIFFDDLETFSDYVSNHRKVGLILLSISSLYHLANLIKNPCFLTKY
jgi:coproporphyrinogen III oxidase